MNESNENKTHWRKNQVMAALMVLMLAAAIVGWLYWKSASLSRYEPIIQAMRAHQLTNNDGRIDLSRTYPGVTPRDETFITYRDDGSMIAFFPTYYGEGLEVGGVIYSSRLLNDDDTHPRGTKINYSQRVISVGIYGNLIIDKRLNDHWYHVSYRLQ